MAKGYRCVGTWDSGQCHRRVSKPGMRCRWCAKFLRKLEKTNRDHRLARGGSAKGGRGWH